jgi:hypothetical protein
MKATTHQMACTSGSAVDIEIEVEIEVAMEGDGAGGCDSAARKGSIPNFSTVVESSAELPWADFCKSLQRPAFLLPVTGFGDLE